ncbi:MAG: Holliday junction branch migration protein RuvA [Verrucomicrobiota bacterium]
MITFLRGTLIEALPNRATIDVNGVGYEVFIPVSTYDALGQVGSQVRVLTHLHVRENEQTLYGFSETDERDLFRLLIDRVSGIGPKLAMAVLSGMSVSAFKGSVVNGDVAALSKISGLGKKTAERIVLELKDKVGVAAAWQAASEGQTATGVDAAVNDAVLALIQLGFKQVEAHKALKKIVDGGEAGADAGVDELIRAALRVLS